MNGEPTPVMGTNVEKTNSIYSPMMCARFACLECDNREGLIC